jgi:cytochrome c-type biogenesis protein CcmF
MIAEAGHFALILALFVAILQATLPLAGAARNNLLWMDIARPAAIAQFILMTFSFGCLIYLFMVSDFSLAIVYQNSHSAKPMLYKISGTWGNHEGSLLLWVLILSLFGCGVAFFSNSLPPTLRARVLAIQSMIAIGFYLFILFTSNPFERLVPPPFDGEGLNPLLQDFGLAIHPPMLYLGYVGFSITFSFAIAALLEGHVDAAWGRWVRPWTLAAWGFLTAGIVLGSWWAYYELGWGGWWFWDPVENASFMPWLAGTALLHSATMVEKRDTMKGWTIFLAIVTFSLSLLGTFLVRSGVLTSVHAFATDPERGLFILILLIIVIGGSFALFAWRGPSIRNKGLFQPISREGSLLLNNLVMTTAAAAVLLGTLYPLFLDAIDGGKVSVGPPFFNSVFIPLIVPMVAAMAIGPLLGWKRSDLGGAIRKLWLAGILTVVAAITTWFVMTDGPIVGVIGIMMATWLGVGTLVELGERIRLFREPLGQSMTRLIKTPRASWGMTIAHFGLAVGIAGMTGAGAWKVESIQTMAPGDTVQVGGYDFTFINVESGQGPNYRITRAEFSVSKDGGAPIILHPENREYPVRSMPTTEAAIHTTFWGDLYAVVGDPVGNSGAYVTRLYWNPLVAWMWMGTALMVLASAISLSDRRYRIGATKRQVKSGSSAKTATATT